MKAERVTRELWDGPNVQAQLWTWNPSLCARNTLFPSPFSLPASTTKVVVQRDSTFLSPIYLDEADIIAVVSRRAGYKSCPSQDGVIISSMCFGPAVAAVARQTQGSLVKRRTICSRHLPPSASFSFLFFVISAPLSRRSRATGDKVNQMKGEPSRDGQIRHSKKLERHWTKPLSLTCD